MGKILLAREGYLIVDGIKHKISNVSYQPCEMKDMEDYKTFEVTFKAFPYQKELKDYEAFDLMHKHDGSFTGPHYGLSRL